MLPINQSTTGRVIQAFTRLMKDIEQISVSPVKLFDGDESEESPTHADHDKTIDYYRFECYDNSALDQNDVIKGSSSSSSLELYIPSLPSQESSCDGTSWLSPGSQMVRGNSTQASSVEVPSDILSLVAARGLSSLCRNPTKRLWMALARIGSRENREWSGEARMALVQASKFSRGNTQPFILRCCRSCPLPGAPGFPCIFALLSNFQPSVDVAPCRKHFLGHHALHARPRACAARRQRLSSMGTGHITPLSMSACRLNA